MMPVEHIVKSHPVYFDAVKRGDKLFEVRRDDRGGGAASAPAGAPSPHEDWIMIAPKTPTPKFIVGECVQKKTGYLWPGIVVAVFPTTGGQTRIVVECTVPEVSGALHIYSPEQIEHA